MLFETYLLTRSYRNRRTILTEGLFDGGLLAEGVIEDVRQITENMIHIGNKVRHYGSLR